MQLVRQTTAHNFLRVTVIVALLLGTSPCYSADSVAELQQAPYSVGYRVLQLPYEDRSLTVAVWYPTDAQPQTHNYGGSTIGHIAPDGELSARKGKYPLLVFSHGYGGSGLSSVFFTETLASMGWIVACPDHYDKYSAVRIPTGAVEGYSRIKLWRSAKEIGESSPEDRDKFSYRPQEMKLSLEGMLHSDIFARHVDRERIAVGGHSFGGFTALSLSGPIKEYYDPRIKAVLLFSTGAGGYLFTDKELQNVRIPSMLFMGEKETTQKRGSKTILQLSEKIFANVARPKYFLVVKDGNHFSFNNRFTDNFFSKRMSGTEAQFAVIRHYAIAFLERYVTGNKAADRTLKHSDPGLTRIESQTSRN